MLCYFALLSPCFASLFWTLTIALRARRNSTAQNIWIAAGAAMTVSTSVWSVCFAGVTDYAAFYKLEVLEAFTTLLLPPLFYFCFRSLTNEKPFGWKMYVWLLPAVAVGAAMAALYLEMGESRAVAYLQATIGSRGAPTGLSGAEYALSLISGPVYSLLVVAQLIFVLVYGTVRLIRYRHRLDEVFSALDGKSLENIRALLVCGYAMLLLSLTPYQGRYHYNEPTLFLCLLMLCWAVAIFVMGLNVSRLEYSAGTLASELEEADRENAGRHPDAPDGAGPAEEKFAGLIRSFEALMDEERIFLQSDLRLDDLAAMMRTNRTYLSRMINEHCGCSFSTAVNRRRIAWAQELMLSHPGMLHEQVAESSGFTHTSSFSRMFRRITGMTCSEWLRQNGPR